MPTAPEAFFLSGSSGARFCVYHPPQGSPRAAVVFVHAWAEELNKARRMVAQQARALAAQGCAVLQLDLQGCGDSSGDFADASWRGWQNDVRDAVAWLRQRAAAPLVLWGLRSGCLLANQVGATLESTPRYLFWQPAVSGRNLLQQFLRLRLAAEMGSGQKGSVDSLKQALGSGQTLHVAGYALGPDLALGLESAALTPPPGATRMAWVEVSTRPEPTLLPASEPVLNQWRAAGHAVHTQAVPGPAFWQTQEIEDAPAILPATQAALDALLGEGALA